ncbi:hypothetical protein KEM48_009946 [Puccinia striiformis f. sp. tritici PST-130]|nr:hypothetical protein KEM48_009946 [Puccinia striiformis f. sp. tritici PST-130]
MESQKDEHVQPGLEAPHHLNGTALLMNARDAALVKRAKLKLDLLLLPILGLFFFLSFLDRANLGNVRIIGLQKDLHMTDYDFSMALTVTFIPYILIELPSNLLVHKIGAGIQIPLTVTIWGLITCLQGLVTSYRGLLVSRFFLGLVEGGLYPAVVLYLSTFYTRSELQLRIALFWGTICISGAASGLLTYAIIKLHGHWGHPGWAWVFLIEGFFTVIFGIIGFFVLPSSIGTVKILTDAEKRCLISRLGPAWMSSTSFTSSATYIQSIPPSRPSSSRQYIRVLSHHHPVVHSPALRCGFHFPGGHVILVGQAPNSGARNEVWLPIHIYPGAYAVSPSLGAWTADNSEPHKRKATAIALGAMVANSGGLFSVWIFVLGKKPRYHLPTAFNIFFGVAIIVCCILNTIWLSHAQKKKVAKRSDILEKFGLRSASASFKQEENESQDQLSEHDMMSAKAWDDLGDQHPDFKYIY